MTEKKKLTTAEILALARKAKAGESVSDDTSAAETAPESKAETTPPTGSPGASQQSGVAESGEQPAVVSKPAAPKSTAEILAAARAQAAAKGVAAKPTEKGAAVKPGSTSDILAAARAQGGGASKAVAGKGAAAKSDEAKAAAQVGVVAKPEGVEAGRPALKEMVAAVKESQATGLPTKPKLPVGKAAPVKPKLPQKAESVGRRGFVAMLSAIAVTPFVLAWSSVGAILGLWTLGTARFMMPNMVLELPSRFKVGAPSDFPPGVVSEKYKASRGVWIVNSSEYEGRGIIYALASICTHLGCTPNWLEGEQKFKCPCHGSGFYITGVNFEGPAPRPLERVGLRVAEDGMLEVDKSVKFQEELGQWADPKSFVNA